MRRLIETVEKHAVVRHSRSSGPGGQNVNKVNTRVTIHIPIDSIDIDPDERRRAFLNLASRINANGELVVSSGATRSQRRNLERAIAIAARLIEGAIVPRPVRRPTGPSRAARERRLSAKRARSQRKRGRRKPDTDE
jgi:ribosome-associated protein